MTIDIAKQNEIRRLHDVEKWKPGTIVAELGVHADVVERVLDPGPAAVEYGDLGAPCIAPGGKSSGAGRRRRRDASSAVSHPQQATPSAERRSWMSDRFPLDRLSRKALMALLVILDELPRTSCTFLISRRRSWPNCSDARVRR